MKINHKRVFWISLAVGWLFDLLFWGKALGISFPLFVFAAIAAGVWAARKDGVQLHRMSWWLLVPIAFFAVMSAVRLEPFTGFLDRTMALFFMTLLANSFQGGRWPFYRLRDHFLRFASLAGATLSRWTKLIAEGRSEDKNGSRQLKAVLRGLLLAVPVFFLFGGLLASADAVFAEYFEDLLELLQLEDLMEYIRRGIVILIVAMGVFGVFYQAMVSSKDEKLPGERIKLASFLGFTETVMALGTAILLFAAFVGIQFRYFFFGEANIAVNGFTYAEYARRGFFELVVVAVLSLALLFGLSTFAKRESGQRQRIFSGAGIVLVALVAVILVSAFLRLSLYEQAYGFTRLRTYAHVFMIWLGVLLAATAALETLRRSDRFALALLLAATGFTASLNILNVDAFITRANIEHAFAFEAEDTIAPGRFQSPLSILDTSYLVSLSPDAVPMLARLSRQAGELDDEVRREMAGGALACHAHRWHDYSRNRPWQSFHFSRWQAGRIWSEYQEAGDSSSGAVLFDENGEAYVKIGGAEIPCGGW